MFTHCELCSNVTTGSTAIANQPPSMLGRGHQRYEQVNIWPSTKAWQLPSSGAVLLNVGLFWINVLHGQQRQENGLCLPLAICKYMVWKLECYQDTSSGALSKRNDLENALSQYVTHVFLQLNALNSVMFLPRFLFLDPDIRACKFTCKNNTFTSDCQQTFRK